MTGVKEVRGVVDMRIEIGSGIGMEIPVMVIGTRMTGMEIGLVVEGREMGTGTSTGIQMDNVIITIIPTDNAIITTIIIIEIATRLVMVSMGTQAEEIGKRFHLAIVSEITEMNGIKIDPRTLMVIAIDLPILHHLPSLGQRTHPMPETLSGS